MLKIKKNKKEIFLFFIITLIFYRSPYIFIHGRFMAEEGSLFFSYAFSNSFLSSIFYIDFNSGYYNLWANISAVIASWFKLEYSPLVTAYLSLIPKLFIFYFILYGNSFLFNNLKNKYIGCLIFLVSPAIVPEVWANTINSQLFFCLLMLIYCFEDFNKKKLNIVVIISIFFAGMTGLYSIILTPIFFFKYRNSGKIQDKYNYYTISFCLVFQLFLVLYAKLNNLIYQNKIHSINVELVINFIYNIVFKSILGEQSKVIISTLNFDPIYYLVTTSLSLCLVIYFFFKNYKNSLTKNIYISLSLIYSFCAFSLFVMIGGVANYVGGRYAVVPSIIFLLILIHLSNLLNEFKIKYLFLIVIITSLCLGFYQYKTNNKYYKFIECVSCPNWQTEVQKWRQQPDYKLKIWPYSMNKTMSLKH